MFATCVAEERVISSGAGVIDGYELLSMVLGTELRFSNRWAISPAPCCVSIVGTHLAFQETAKPYSKVVVSLPTTPSSVESSSPSILTSTWHGWYFEFWLF